MHKNKNNVIYYFNRNKKKTYHLCIKELNLTNVKKIGFPEKFRKKIHDASRRYWDN